MPFVPGEDLARPDREYRLVRSLLLLFSGVSRIDDLAIDKCCVHKRRQAERLIGKDHEVCVFARLDTADAIGNPPQAGRCNRNCTKSVLGGEALANRVAGDELQIGNPPQAGR